MHFSPETTITIPGRVLRIASKLILKPAAVALQEKGIYIDELIKLYNNPEINGPVVEIEDHKKNEKVWFHLSNIHKDNRTNCKFYDIQEKSLVFSAIFRLKTIKLSKIIYGNFDL